MLNGYPKEKLKEDEKDNIVKNNGFHSMPHINGVISAQSVTVSDSGIKVQNGHIGESQERGESVAHLLLLFGYFGVENFKS
jgi:hypothetical protein